MSPDVVLSAMLALPQFSRDTLTDSERRELLGPVAAAIASVAHTREDAAFLVAQGWHESRWAAAVISGHCELMPKGMQCDPDKHGVPRARGPWQLWASACRADDLRGQAKCVLGIGKLGLQRCASWSGAFYAMRGHWACGEDAAREQTMRRVLAGWGRP